MLLIIVRRGVAAGVAGGEFLADGLPVDGAAFAGFRAVPFVDRACSSWVGTSLGVTSASGVVADAGLPVRKIALRRCGFGNPGAEERRLVNCDHRAQGGIQRQQPRVVPRPEGLWLALLPGASSLPVRSLIPDRPIV